MKDVFEDDPFPKDEPTTYDSTEIVDQGLINAIK